MLIFDDLEPPKNVEYINIKPGKGAQLVCKCDISSNVEWRRVDGKPLPANSTIVENKLVIENVGINDDGSYECECHDPESNETQPAQRKVVAVAVSPTIVFDPSMPSEFDTDAVVIVHCLVLGEGSTETNWSSEKYQTWPK